MLPGVAAEMGEGPFMGFEKLGEPLIRTGVIEPAATEAQREHEHVDDLRAGAKGHQGLAPINLTLLPRWGLKPEQGPVCVPLDFAQRGHTPLHGLVTAGIAAACPQLLIQNPRRVPDLWGAGLHKVGMGRSALVNDRGSEC
jgi:hypothetical protein